MPGISPVLPPWGGQHSRLRAGTQTTGTRGLGEPADTRLGRGAGGEQHCSGGGHKLTGGGLRADASL